MAMATVDSAFELPKLRVSVCWENDTKLLGHDDNVAEFFDVKFCPYQPLDCDPVFAAVSKKHVVLCRLSRSSGDSNPCEVINYLRDDDDEASACCCTWIQDPITGDPYICIGGVDAKVKIYDVVNGKEVECFVGHGGDVNDLATSPVDSSMIASASDDTTLRIWSLRPQHKEQPCLAILAGEGHSWGLLSVAFHNTGRYLLSSGHDQIINLWTLPDLPTEPTSVPIQIHYPHFSTSAVHNGIVDCVAFYGDLILSRACHDNVIVLWRIEGFSSDGPPPPRSIAPTLATPINHDEPTRLTRSAFVPTLSTQCPFQYTRLAAFQTPNCGPQFFMRFKLHCVPDQNPVLAFCNAGGQIYFWDMARITAYYDFIKALNDPDVDKSTLRLPSWLKPVVRRPRTEKTGKARVSGIDRESRASAQAGSTKQDPPPNSAEPRSQTPSAGHAAGTPGEGGAPSSSSKSAGPADGGKAKDGLHVYSEETLEVWAARYSVENPQEPLRAHKVESSNANFVGRQAAWSPGGEWCVIVGSDNTTLILQRWAERNPHRATINGANDN